ncbi:MAG: hypothetical protein E6G66_14665 [Actinobacteria bacterium]|nr:MAG: hypothetical protein E6G66_14665 [Actinomycetota bacterium]
MSKLHLVIGLKGGHDMTIETAELRRIQYLIVLLSCLPRGGKCREVFELALALDEVPQMARVSPPNDLDTHEGSRLWLESLWAQEDLSPEERRVVWWQGTNENMEDAIRELKAVESRLGETWIRTVIPAGSFHEGGR